MVQQFLSVPLFHHSEIVGGVGEKKNSQEKNCVWMKNREQQRKKRVLSISIRILPSARHTLHVGFNCYGNNEIFMQIIDNPSREDSDQRWAREKKCVCVCECLLVLFRGKTFTLLLGVSSHPLKGWKWTKQKKRSWRVVCRVFLKLG